MGRDISKELKESTGQRVQLCFRRASICTVCSLETNSLHLIILCTAANSSPNLSNDFCSNRHTLPSYAYAASLVNTCRFRALHKQFFVEYLNLCAHFPPYGGCVDRLSTLKSGYCSLAFPSVG